MSDMEKARIQLWQSFEYKVTKATAKLLYLLQAMEVIRNSFSVVGDCTFPCISRLNISPIVSVDNLGDLLTADGEVEQIAFKGWVEEVYNLWEHHRSEWKELFEGDGIIRPEIQCMGDFRLIRNDFIHSGIATQERSGKCEVLKWFEPPEQIVFKTRHVVDLLHQMGLLRLPRGLMAEGQTPRLYGWRLVPDRKTDAFDNESGIRLISVRLSTDKDGEDGSTIYMVSCAFNDGVFGHGPVETSISSESFNKATIGEDGDLHFPEGQVIKAKVLYDACVGFLEGRRAEGKGIGMYGPAFRFRRDIDD